MPARDDPEGRYTGRLTRQWRNDPDPSQVAHRPRGVQEHPAWRLRTWLAGRDYECCHARGNEKHCGDARNNCGTSIHSFRYHTHIGVKPLELLVYYLRTLPLVAL